MKVNFIKHLNAFQDGRLVAYRAGKEYDLTPEQAEKLERSGIVRIVAEREPAPETAERIAAPIKARRSKAPELMAR